MSTFPNHSADVTMIAPPTLRRRVLDVNPSGQTEKQFVLGSSSIEDKSHSRVQIVSTSKTSFGRSRILYEPIVLLKDVFLPAGYPASVGSDYTAYQFHDTLQAFTSSIAGLLSSRAVLTGIGVGDTTATPTSALLLHIAQDSTGRLATILFAHRLGSALEPETKMYRLLADVFNDISIILDCASPLFPRGIARVSVLSTAGILRALCGVAAGATKASLSVHFAAGGDGSGSVAEINAKDASQETVISLLGSLVGSVVVSWITDGAATWCVLLVLLAVHLGMNWRAVRAVRIRTLNRQRAGIVFGGLFAGRGLGDPEWVAGRERVFERDGVIRDPGDKIIGWTRIGVGVEAVLRQLEPLPDLQPQQPGADTLSTLLSLTGQSHYILAPTRRTRDTVLIALSKAATAEHQLQSWAHSILLHRRLATLPPHSRASIPTSTLLEMIVQTYEELTSRWVTDISLLNEKGWDIDTASLETRSGWRFEVENEDKDKDVISQ